MGRRHRIRKSYVLGVDGLRPEYAVSGFVDKIVSAVVFIEFQEQLHAIGDGNLLLAKKAFNMFDPGGDFRESFCRVQMRFSDDAEWRVPREIELAFGVNMR
jgi:hypothetical protein